MGKISAEVYLYNKKVGLLEHNDEGYLFEYYDNYYGPALSLSLPTSTRLYQAKQLFPYFKSLLPEGWLLQQYTQSQKLDSRDHMGLLINNGEDMIGAVSIRATSNTESSNKTS